MKIKSVLLVSAVLSFVLSNASANMELSKYAKVYKGGEGAVVTMIPLSPPTEKKALIHVTGIDTQIDGLVMLYTLEDWGNAEAYVMEFDGSKRARLRTQKDYWSKWTTLYLPGVKDGIEVEYDEKASKAVKSDDFLKIYMDKNHAKVQAELAKFKRDKHVARADADLAKIAKEASAKCGSDIKAAIDWKSISDDYLKELSISSYCGSPLEGLAYLCGKSDENKKALSAKVAQVNCKMGEKIHIGIANKVLNWTTTKDTPNQDDFARYVLMNEL